VLLLCVVGCGAAADEVVGGGVVGAVGAGVCCGVVGWVVGVGAVRVVGVCVALVVFMSVDVADVVAVGVGGGGVGGSGVAVDGVGVDNYDRGVGVVGGGAVVGGVGVVCCWWN